jgi:subtilisin family serine protease
MTAATLAGLALPLALAAAPEAAAQAAANPPRVHVTVPPPRIVVPKLVIPRPLANRPERLLPNKEKDDEGKPRQGKTVKIKRAKRVAKPKVERVQLPNGAVPIPPLRRAASNQTGQEPDVVVVSLPAGASDALAQAIAQDNNLTVLGQSELALLNRRIVRLHIPDGRSVDGVVAALGGDARLTGVQASIVYAANGDRPSANLQYAASKLKLAETHRVASGRSVRIAIIDTGVDARHEALRAAHLRVESVLDGGKVTPGHHGTQIAGIIAASGKMTGIAPEAELIAIEAFGPPKKGPARSTTYAILRALDRAFAERAQVVNMSFSGGRDPLMIEALDALADREVLLIAAAGNEGPGAAPAWPGNHPRTIAVTATDARDAVFAGANRGSYVALAAPGVQILAPGAGGTYLLDSGTSFAAAYASGAAALILQGRPELKPRAVREILAGTAHDLGKPGPDPDYGAGLIDPLAALTGGERVASPARRPLR